MTGLFLYPNYCFWLFVTKPMIVNTRPAISAIKPKGIVRNISQIAEPPPLPLSLHMLPPGGVMIQASASGENANKGPPSNPERPIVRAVFFFMLPPYEWYLTYGKC